MSAQKSYPPRAGRHAGRSARTLILAAGLIEAALLLVLGCRIDVPLPETEEQLAAQRAAGANTITAFSFDGVGATGTIDQSAKTIAVTVPFATDVMALVATFATTGKTVKVGSIVQVSGTTANNFSAPVTYTVTAADGSTASYVVTVTVQAAPPPPRNLIALSTYRDGNSEIYVMKDDGSDLVNLTRNPANDSHPAWSPNRTRLAFASDRSGTSQIYVMNADGSGLTRLPLTDPGIAVYDPAWSPDGARIAFVVPGTVDWKGDNVAGYIATAKPDGTDVRKMTPELSGFGFGWPAWSPDGSRIVYSVTWDSYAFILGASLPWDLNITNVDGTESFGLTTNLQNLADGLWPGPRNT